MQKYLQAEVQSQLEFAALTVLMNPGQADPEQGCTEHSTHGQDSTQLHSDHASSTGTELTILPSVSQRAAGA